MRVCIIGLEACDWVLGTNSESRVSTCRSHNWVDDVLSLFNFDVLGSLTPPRSAEGGSCSTHGVSVKLVDGGGG